MLVDGAGQIIVDALTANRSLASIPSASSILDTSNYTILAVSFGKDADGFTHHAHEIISPSGTYFGKRIIKVLSYENTSILTYHTSATASAIEFTYKLLPASPSPLDKKLEFDSTVPNYSSGVTNVGHCLNSVIDSNLSSFHHLIGCFPASGGTEFWMVSSISNASASIIISGTLSSFYNKNLIMDTSGFLTFANGTASTHNSLNNASDFTKGALRYCDANSPSKLAVKIKIGEGDCGALLLYGGIYHIGLWVLDIKETLKQGVTAPFNFNALNNKRKYKLFAKKTFSKDLLFLIDQLAASAMKEQFAMEGGFKQGQTILWYINFI